MKQLESIAHRIMIQRGLLPDFSPAASIDNDSSRDLDQLSVSVPMGGSDVKILVAIADVDAVVKRHSAIDEHAATNTTSVYTAAAMFPMLPLNLSTDLTSLGEDQDRMAIVVEMVVDTAGVVKQSDVYRALVRNHAKLAYNATAAWLDGTAAAPPKVANIPGMDAHTALTFKLAQEFLRDLLPRSTVRSLQGYFTCADQLLRARQPRRIGVWPHKISVLARGQQLQPPTIRPEVLDAVYEGLFDDRQVRLTYRARHDQGVRTHEANPLAIVYRSGIGYLVCTTSQHADAIQLALHRITAATVLTEPAQRLPGFNLQTYIRSGAFGYRLSDATIKLEAIFERQAGQHFFEVKLGDDQCVQELPDGRVRVRATVNDTSELRWFLAGYGDRVEVMRPVTLRREFSEQARRLMRLYAGQKKSARA